MSATVIVVLLLVVIFSLRQISGTEIEMEEKEAIALLEKLDKSGVLLGEKFIYANSKRNEKDTLESVIVHKTSFNDEVVGEVDAEEIKNKITSFSDVFLEKIIKTKAFDGLNATKVFSFSGGDKRIQFDFTDPIPDEFGYENAIGCASLAFDKDDNLISVTLYFEIDEGKEMCTVLFGDIELDVQISTGGIIVLTPVEK